LGLRAVHYYVYYLILFTYIYAYIYIYIYILVQCKDVLYNTGARRHRVDGHGWCGRRRVFIRVLNYHIIKRTGWQDFATVSHHKGVLYFILTPSPSRKVARALSEPTFGFRRLINLLEYSWTKRSPFSPPFPTSPSTLNRPSILFHYP